ncbi:pot family protein [Ophiostoma piceae UAMH 11346]|uniref:Pot family protein n=1 Tax=Ophiostoma piceae (strain UAMH 11346) TaxID=1262450 RepID=S3BTV5_OPHP1|nr:pot family protein [Ophiostoma piceae UAMH 11346]
MEPLSVPLPGNMPFRDITPGMVDVDLTPEHNVYSADGITLLGKIPSPEQLRTLQRVSSKIPFKIYTITFLEFCERFSYYGSVTVLTNFIQWPMPEGSTSGSAPHGQAGALGYGQRTATAIATVNVFWQYMMPLVGAYVADCYWGRFRTISVALLVDLIGHFIMIVAALPCVLGLESKAPATAALVLGLMTMGIGTGGFKPNINPLVVEQLAVERMYVKTLFRRGKKEEKVIVDPAVTNSRVFHYFYMFVNLGALFGQIGMVYAEKYVGFWLSFSLPMALLCLCPAVIFWGRTRYRRVPPQGSVLGNAVRLFIRANAGRWSLNLVTTYRKLHDGTFWEAVKPSNIAADERPVWMTFDDAWVDEVRRGVHACSVFLSMPIFWLCYNQVTSNLTSQAATLRLDNVPNDVIGNLEPIALIVLILMLNEIAFPLLRRYRLNITPIKKITAGYLIASIAMAWAAVLQHCIYKKSVCGKYASGDLPNTDPPERCPPVDISVWAQTGVYVLTAFAEILASVTCLEYAQSKAPSNMRSMVQAFSLCNNAISSALGFAIVALAADPYLVWNYSIVAGLAFVAGIVFWFVFRGLDHNEDEMNLLPIGTTSKATPDAGKAEEGGM